MSSQGVANSGATGLHESRLGDFHMLVGGKLLPGPGTREIINPSDESVLASAPEADQAILDQAVAAALDAFPAWAGLSWDKRADYLLELADAMEVHRAELAELLSLEQGKPLQSLAFAEIDVGIAFLQETARLRLPIKTLRDTETLRVEVHHVPMGVVGAITPWNFPVQLSIWKIAPNLLAGNTMVLKPAPTSPLTMLRLGELAADVLPLGVLNIVAGGNALGERLVAHPDVAKITFTGSTGVGKAIMAGAAATLKRLVLELGGNDAGIVLPDVDVEALAPVLFWAAFYNGGQNCVAIKRLYVHDAIYDALLAALVAYAATVRVGPSQDSQSDIGPVQNKQHFDRLTQLISDAEKQGLQFAFRGAAKTPRKGYFVPVTIIDNPPETSRIVSEEQFGPILPVLRYASEDEVVARANASPMALAASVWGKDAERVGARLQAGTIWTNQAHIFSADIPFCGHKQSGYGVELGEEGLAACMAVQVHTAVKPSGQDPGDVAST